MTTTVTAMAAATPATDLLILLHRYDALHRTASSELKASFWDLAKARRGRAYQTSVAGGIGFSADDVREELRPRALLEWKDGRDGDEGDGRAAPELVEESDRGGESKGRGSGFMLHLDGMDGVRDRRRAVPNDAAARHEKAGEQDGLRRRKGKGEGPKSKHDDAKWIAENHAADKFAEEEARLRRADPLELFGVPPPALREAQAKSRSAVAHYVEVANLAREMAELMNRERGSGREG